MPKDPEAALKSYQDYQLRKRYPELTGERHRRMLNTKKNILTCQMKTIGGRDCSWSFKTSHLMLSSGFVDACYANQELPKPRLRVSQVMAGLIVDWSVSFRRFDQFPGKGSMQTLQG